MIDDLPNRTIRKVAIRTVPLLAIIFLISFLDRVNIGFAAVTMNADLGISATTYGWAAGIFFIGYVIFQIPSNIALNKIGARRWLPVIIVTWGLISMGMALVKTGESLMIARFLLGAAEAGFFPGVILYLTLWFPPSYRARIVAGFMFASPISNMIGAPVSGVILNSMDGVLGFAGWQWLFVIEGFPALLGAAAVLAWLPDNPQGAQWLTREERAWLVAELERAEAASPASARPGILGTMFHPAILICALVYMGLATGNLGISLWMPLIVAEAGTSPLMTGLLSGIPYAFAAAAMLIWGRVADRGGQGAKYVWLPALVAAAALAAGAYADDLPTRLVFLTITMCAILAFMPAFWAWASPALVWVQAGIGIAMINSTGNLGSFIGPIAIGWVRDQTQSFQMGLISVAAVVAAGGLLAMVPLKNARIQPRAA